MWQGTTTTPYAALPEAVHAGGRVLQSVAEDWADSGNGSAGTGLLLLL
jgi:hypothetical protein